MEELEDDTAEDTILNSDEVFGLETLNVLGGRVQGSTVMTQTQKALTGAVGE